jgi:hypothetical protein
VVIEPQIDTDESSSESEDDNVRFSEEENIGILRFVT